MSMVAEDVDLREALDDLIPCQGKLHPTGKLGHDDGPARFIIRSPCGCHYPGVFQCAGRTNRLRDHPAGMIGCTACRKVAPVEQWQFIPI